MVNTSVGIVGCGWLGKALTTQLVDANMNVVVTTQRSENVEELSKLGAQVECFSAQSGLNVCPEKALNVFNQKCLVIAITPMIRQGRTDYADKIRCIVEYANKGAVEQIILVSSTAVYNGNIGDVDETTDLDLSQEKVSILNAAEQEALSFLGNTIVLRLSGLVGPKRHPGKFLRAGKTLSDPNAITNLIHQTDAVGLLFELIKNEKHTAIYNGSSQTHVSKKDYYAKAANALGISAPRFHEGHRGGDSKVINSGKIRNKLTYQFKYDDLLTWLDEKQP